MTILLSIDGGNRAARTKAAKAADLHRQCYVAEYHAGTLYALHALNRAQALRAIKEGLTCDAVAFEVPDYLKPNTPPKVVFGLLRNVCAVAYTLAAGGPVHEYTVNNGVDTDWIGGVQKPVLHQRIWRALTGPERKIFPACTADDIEAASEKHSRTRKITEHVSYNTLDAAGVGLFHLGRIGKGGTR